MSPSAFVTCAAKLAARTTRTILRSENFIAGKDKDWPDFQESDCCLEPRSGGHKLIFQPRNVGLGYSKQGKAPSSRRGLVSILYASCRYMVEPISLELSFDDTALDSKYAVYLRVGERAWSVVSLRWRKSRLDSCLGFQ